MTSIWRSDVQWEGLSEAAVAPEQADVVVVGSGLSGLFAALEHARTGLKVVVLEAGDISSGASSRSGGMAGPSFFKLGLKGLAGRYGDNATLRVMSESLDAFAWLKRFIQNEAVDCDFTQIGRFRGARNAKSVKELYQHADYINQHFDWPISSISKKDTGNYIGSTAYDGAILYENDATLHPGKLSRALAELVIAAGGVIVPHSRVTNVASSYGGFEVSTAKIRIKAQSVLMATNGYSGNLFPFLKRRIIPIRSAIIATESLPEELVGECVKVGRAYGEANRGVSYFRASPDGTRILFGGRALDWKKDNPAEYAKHLERRLKSVFPQLSPCTIESCWSGKVAYTFDHIPHFGEYDGLFYVGGYCGSGMARAPYCGHLVARQMQGFETTSIFSKLSMPTRRLYTGRPWFLGMVLRWNEFLDKI